MTQRIYPVVSGRRASLPTSPCCWSPTQGPCALGPCKDQGNLVSQGLGTVAHARARPRLVRASSKTPRTGNSGKAHSRASRRMLPKPSPLAVSFGRIAEGLPLSHKYGGGLYTRRRVTQDYNAPLIQVFVRASMGYLRHTGLAKLLSR